MNRLALILIAFLFIYSPVQAEEGQTYGFQDIPFGTSFEEMKITLQKKYEYGFPTVQILGDFIKLNDFKLGNRNFDVFLQFDKDKKFYIFSFDGKGKAADHLETDVYDDLKYLNEVFESKYGKPADCNSPNILKIGVYNQIICNWEHKNLSIVTTINFNEFKYNAMGMVSDKQLERAETSKNKKEKKKGAAEGAKAF